ncbi:hypothetical protein [Gemmatimonas sp.]|uniref:hypothetical protein n=1 Tax=Gemmatimonas sp. TaxID=1962908 RepID=UPI00333E4D93
MRLLQRGSILGAACLTVALYKAPVAAAQMAPVALQQRQASSDVGQPFAPAYEASSALATGGVPADRPAPWWAPAASGVVPGAGQFALKQQRSVAYLVAEAFLVVQYLAARRDGNRERDAYRALAVSVARKPFAGSQLGNWDYYERLEQFLESGAFDRIPGGVVDPETDASTFNGFRWQLARETFWRDPNVAPALASAEYQRALAFYERQAVGEAFRWSWRDARLQQDVYVQTIRSANRSYQRAVNMLGIVAVNHLASLIDAYVSVRLRRFGAPEKGGSGMALGGIETTYDVTPLGQARFQAGVRLVAR